MRSHAELIKAAYETLYGEEFKYVGELKYSARFKGYNANVKMHRNKLSFALSKKWRPISTEIKVGLLQELMVKILRRKAHTINMDLYNYFLKSVDKTIAVTQSDPLLETVFHKINAQYFYGLMDNPNLKWGSLSTSLLGHYDFGEDMITISRVFHPDNCQEQELLEFVMYHEMLHKHHKFESRHGRTASHTPAFRRDEAKFPDKVNVEKRMGLHASSFRGAKTTRKKRWNFLDYF
ncbi:MAG: hypothetical protein ACE5FT_02210 [Candidatus Nanoarchaeia archaeon]